MISQRLTRSTPVISLQGGSALVIILGTLVALGVVPARIPVQFVMAMAGWRLLRDILRNPAFRRLLPHYNALVEVHEVRLPNDDSPAGSNRLIASNTALWPQ